MSRTALALTIAALAGAGAGGAKVWWEMAPVRLAVTRDTLVVYVGRAEQVPIDAFSRSGQPVYMYPRYEPTSDDVFESSVWNIACHRAGERDVTISYKRLAVPLHVSCRKPVSIHGANSFELEVGEASPVVRLSVRLDDGRMIALGEDRLTVDDTSIAVLSEGRLHARRAGRTRMHVVAGLISLVPISVTERLAFDTLELRPGEFRKWPLAAGRYDIAVRNLSGARRSFAEFEMIGEGTRCVPARLDPDLIHCLVSDTGVVAVHNRLASGTGRSPRTMVSIVRTQ